MPTTREGVRKGPAAEAERDASQHAVGGIARVFFFLFIFIHLKLFFFTFVSRPVDSTQPDQFFYLERLGGGLLPYFCVEKRPGVLFRKCFTERPGGRLLHSLRYSDTNYNQLSLCGAMYIRDNGCIRDSAGGFRRGGGLVG